ncbi:YhcN/YlaJ family sporulation lipoprotein [Halobacillus shinanisalinarum]|uniref:YhcN/YlaJ family sporulation lipoprotein n=1 Tax=Halobacillus shinanisalinarum TaxID=2932258 RepID=A0ABY4H286_9BACI|nr:YhcN/YlaJ family sporulation lipoprotein [Halobacillus shinanisalinarum]UOQ94245.1 YhcN/YlaJ family sporulation lipoprotein [Halobacillus shinanisalinarum]
MKTYRLLPILMGLSFMVLAGCNEAQEEEARNQEPDQALHSNEMDDYNDRSMDGQVGYVRYKQGQFDQNDEKNQTIKVNREKVADMITRMILKYDGFEDVATLVTDEEVLVAYQTPEGQERELSADMVQKTAYSLVPSFYHVYVSDNPSAFGDIQSLSTTTVYDDQYEEVVDDIINKMKEAPQGKANE